MNNQGLEALAALASAAPASTTTTTSRSENGDSKTTAAAPSDTAGSGTGPLEGSTANLSAAAQLVASLQQKQATPPQATQSAHTTTATSVTPTLQHAAHPTMALGQAQFNNAAVAAASALAPSSAGAPDLAMLQQLQRTSTDPSIAMVLQNIAYYQLLLQSQQQQQAQNVPAALASLLTLNPNGTVPATAANHHAMHVPVAPQPDPTPNTTATAPKSMPQQHRIAQQHHLTPSQQQQVPKHATQQLLYGSNKTASAPAATSAPATLAAAAMPPPAAPSSPIAAPAPLAVARAGSGGGPPPAFPRTVLAPNPPPQGSSSTTHSSGGGGGGGHRESDDDGECDSSHADDKKEQKRAANRRSAQLSRKRKKQFIEELKDENDDLRRKEQILKSIPDLVVVFDSTGKLWFVSQSISRFVGYKSHELEGKSFWDRLCPESVRLLKAAFMDSLAARESHTDTVPLGDGLWDLRLADKDGSFVSVTLNGVVHFAGERPECVCCIRPKDTASSISSRSTTSREGGPELAREAVMAAEEDPEGMMPPTRPGMLVSDFSSTNNSTAKSVASTAPLATGVLSSSGPVENEKAAAVAAAAAAVNNGSSAIRISDSGNSSGESESGSSDELNATN